MKTLQEIRDTLGDSVSGLLGYVPIKGETEDVKKHTQDAIKALQALDEIISQIPEDLGNAVKNTEFDLFNLTAEDSDKVLKAAKLLHSIKGGE